MDYYSIDRDVLAKMIAGHTSGLEDVEPEEDDYDLADRFIDMIDHRFDEPVFERTPNRVQYRSMKVVRADDNE